MFRLKLTRVAVCGIRGEETRLVIVSVCDSAELTNEPGISAIILDSQAKKVLLKSNDGIRLRLHGQRSFDLLDYF